ncbi:MAG: hypothetical protein KatS3mg111_2279 [Pirellulaceae bacterium]|nr:MAG: hypothetical protein KatS3mg111_2279 [Pirellulaceae bacterium]
MNKYGAICDEFYINMYLNTEMELPQNREAVMHFFEQVQKRFPRMTNFYTRDRGEYFLEEDKDSGSYRWVSAEIRRLASGVVNPESVEGAIEQHVAILDLIPYELSVSHLDCESLNITMGFDYAYRGNHSELLAEVLGMPAALERFAESTGSSILGYEPVVALSLDAECRTQCRVAFETRSSAYQLRTGEYTDDPLSVYLTVRRVDSLGSNEQFGSELRRLARLCERLVDEYLVDEVLRPLQKAIALK